MDTPVAYELQERIEVRGAFRLVSGESPGIDQRLDRHVVVAFAQAAEPFGQTEVVDDMFVERIGFSPVDAAQQGGGVENRHRSLGFGVARMGETAV